MDMDTGQEKRDQSTSLNDKQYLHSTEQSPLSLVKEANGSKDSVDGDTPRNNVVEQNGPAGSPSPNSQTDKSAERTVRTRSQGKRDRGPDLLVVSALAADVALPLRRRGRHESEEPISPSLDALASRKHATGKESIGSAEREKRIRRPSSRLLNGKIDVSSPTGSLNSGPDLTSETQNIKKRRLSKLKKKTHSSKAKNKTNDIDKAGEKDEQGGNDPSEGVKSADKAVTPAADGSKSNTRVKKRKKPRKLPDQSTVSPEGKQITLFFAGQSETHETQLQEGMEVTEEPSKNAGHRITPRKRKGRSCSFKIGSKGDLPPAGTSVSESDDQPLSMLFGRPNAKNSRHSSLGDEAGESQKNNMETPTSKAGESQKNNMETPTSKAEESSKKKSNKATPKSQAVVEWSGSSLFIKSSPVWKALQQMEVFLKFPQNPHFLPLKDLKEGCREGLAIGNMVTFANIVDKALKLTFSDSVGSIHACLETLLELEVHGFDITAIQDHLKKLLFVKEGQEKLQERKKEVVNQIAELTTEKVRIDEEIIKFSEEVKHLKEVLAAAKSRKQEKRLEIGELKLKLASITKLIDEAAALNVEDGTDYYLKVSHFL